MAPEKSNKSKIVPPKWIVPLTLTVWILFLYGFWRIGDPFPLLSVSHGVFTIEQVKHQMCISFINQSFERDGKKNTRKI